MKNNPELFEHRFEVIATYPKGPAIDTVLPALCQENKYAETVSYFTNKDFSIDDLQDFPHLFRHMAWWEYRAFEIMPTWVKKISDKGYYRPGDVLEVRWAIIHEKGQAYWQAGVGKSAIDSSAMHTYNASEVFPATETEIKNAIEAKCFFK